MKENPNFQPIKSLENDASSFGSEFLREIEEKNAQWKIWGIAKKTILLSSTDDHFQLILEEQMMNEGNDRWIASVFLIASHSSRYSTIIDSFRSRKTIHAIDENLAWKKWEKKRERKRMMKNARRMKKIWNSFPKRNE